MHTIWGLLQINFFAYYKGALSDQFLRILFGSPFGSVLLILYGGPLRSISSLTKWAPRSVFLLTIWGPPQTSFFAYELLCEAPSDLFLAYCMPLTKNTTAYSWYIYYNYIYHDGFRQRKKLFYYDYSTTITFTIINFTANIFTIIINIYININIYKCNRGIFTCGKYIYA